MTRQVWSREKVIECIKERNRSGNSLQLIKVRKEDSALYAAAKRRFGSYKNAVIASGFDYYRDITERKHDFWTPDKVLDSINDLERKGESLSDGNIGAQYKDLYYMAYKFYGTWGNAVIAAGLDYESYMLKKTNGFWTREVVKRKLQQLYREGIPLNYCSVRASNGDLYNAGVKLFESWSNALESALGVDYETIRLDSHQSSYLGLKFERILEGILSELYTGVTSHNTYENLHPDFILSNGRWVDAKLSYWTVFNSETIKRYEPHCRQLTIVYMRGNEDTDEMITTKTRILSVYKLIKQLPKYRQIKYENEINELNNQLIQSNNKYEDKVSGF